jgi:hypothetical protein
MAAPLDPKLLANPHDATVITRRPEVGADHIGIGFGKAGRAA